MGQRNRDRDRRPPPSRAEPESVARPPAPTAAAPAAPGAAPPASVIVCDGWRDGYGLLDSGHGRKLERFGPITLDRPEPLAFWAPSSPTLWSRADARFDAATDDDDSGRWRMKSARDGGEDDTFVVPLGRLKFVCRLTSFRHVGLFPEQEPHWRWMQERIDARTKGGEAFRLLNLFGYTGAASLAAAASGAEVCHVDASKKAIGWARENQAASRLEAAPIRWICDDAMKFAAREVRRGARYHGVVLDPPKFGRGPKNEVWNLADDLPGMMRLVSDLLADDASFVILTAYAVRLSYFSLYELMRDSMDGRAGAIDAGELVLRDGAGRFAPTSLFARWAGRA